MKTLNLTITAIRIPIDAAMIILAGWTAYWIRINPVVTKHLPVKFSIDTTKLATIITSIAILWIAIFALNKLYTIKRRAVREEILSVIYAISTGMMLVFTVVFFSQEIFESRFIVLAAWVLAMVFTITARMLIRIVHRLLLAKGYGQHSVIIIGPEETAEPLITEFKNKPSQGFKIIGTRKNFSKETKSWITRKNNKTEIDEIILANPNANRTEALELVTFCDQNHIDFLYTADLLEASTSRLEPHTFAGIPLFEVKKTPLDGWGKIYKRTFDILLSIILIILTLPIQIIVATILLFERQGGFLLYKLPNGKPFVRIGEKGKPFTFLKFRSMVKDAHKLRYDDAFLKANKIEDTRKGSPLSKFKKDPRITKFGNIIRKTSIDEIPQFYLVLTGKMSLIGPRPHLPEEVAKYKPEYKKVLNIKPGITGISQTSGRHNLNFEEEIRLDTHYIENWSPWLDLTILIKTPFKVIRGSGEK